MDKHNTIKEQEARAEKARAENRRHMELFHSTPRKDFAQVWDHEMGRLCEVGSCESCKPERDRLTKESEGDLVSVTPCAPTIFKPPTADLNKMLTDRAQVGDLFIYLRDLPLEKRHDLVAGDHSKHTRAITIVQQRLRSGDEALRAELDRLGVTFASTPIPEEAHIEEVHVDTMPPPAPLELAETMHTEETAEPEAEPAPVTTEKSD